MTKTDPRHGVEFGWTPHRKQPRNRKRGETVSERKAMNERHLCAIPDCRNRRHNFSKYCKTHSDNETLYGSPVGRHYPREEYAQEIAEVESFLVRFADHPSLEAAVRWVDAWLDKAVMGMNVPARLELRRLYDYGIRGKDIIRAFLPLWFFSDRNRRTLRDDINLTFAIGHAILLLAPRGGRLCISKRSGKAYKYYPKLKKTAKREVGETVRRFLGVFALNAIQYMNAQVVRERELQNSMRVPFPQKQEKEVMKYAQEGGEAVPRGEGSPRREAKADDQLEV